MSSRPITAEIAAVRSTTETSSDPILNADGGSITLSNEGQARVVTLVGDIDVKLRDQASTVLVSIATSRSPVAIDMSRVTSIDETGIAFVLQLATVEQEQGMPIVLRGAADDVVSTFQDLGISDHFVVAP